MPPPRTKRSVLSSAKGATKTAERSMPARIRSPGSGDRHPAPVGSVALPEPRCQAPRMSAPFGSRSRPPSAPPSQRPRPRRRHGRPRALSARATSVCSFLYRSIAESGLDPEPRGGLRDGDRGRQVRADARRFRTRRTARAPLVVHRRAGALRSDSSTRTTTTRASAGPACRAIIAACQRQPADIVHANDWHTGLFRCCRGAFTWDRLFAGTRTLFSIHNLGYQGVFGAEAVDRMGLVVPRSSSTRIASRPARSTCWRRG